MKSKTVFRPSTRQWLASLILLAAATLPSTYYPAVVHAASSTTTVRTPRSQRRRRRRRTDPAATVGGSIISARTAAKLIPNDDDDDNSSRESLKERWVDILSWEQQEHNGDSVRLENRRERQYYYEAEILADRLLGLDENDDSNEPSSQPPSTTERHDSLLSKELSILWKTIAIASSVLLIGMPLLSLLGNVLSSDMVQNALGALHSTMTPYLIPTASLIRSSVRDWMLHAEAVLHSMPYLLRHFRRIRIRPLPLLYKVVRKCLIVEAWRHIWTRVYKLSRYLWRGTLKNARGAYVKVVPAWIRRGVKSMFQSMVQAHVHGVVGGFVTEALGGVTFEGWAWSGSGGTESAAQGMENTMQEAILDSSDAALSETMVGAAVEEALVESIISEEAVDSVAEGVGSAVEEALVESIISEEAVESMAESVGSAVEQAVESIISEETVDAIVESVESTFGDAVESIVDDCISEGGCVDQAMESILD